MLSNILGVPTIAKFQVYVHSSGETVASVDLVKETALNMNLINILFMQLTFVVVILGTLVTLIEKYLPTSIRQMFRYGKHAHKESSDKLVEKIELPKAWFSHFYVFAVFWSWIWFILAVSIYFFDHQPHQYLIAYLDLSCGSDRAAESKKNLEIASERKLETFRFSFASHNVDRFRIDDGPMFKTIHRKQLSSNIFKEEQN